MEFKGTKGNFYARYVNGFIIIIDKDDNNVLDTPFKELNEANALLISKAPEMLEMLERILSGQFIDTNEVEQLIKEATNN
jgi:hypothetical protein